jgi:hypothetical protein
LFSVDEALDDMLEGSDDEQESNKIIDQVLGEIGIEISGKVSYFYFLIYSEHRFSMDWKHFIIII